MTSVLPPVILTGKYVVAKPPNAHDAQVVAHINKCIDDSYAAVLASRGGDKIATVSFVLDKAQCACMNGRKGPLDLVGRDAEYYLKLRWAVAEDHSLFAKLFTAAWTTFANGLYNALKFVMICAGFEQKMRTDPEVMVTSPGGVVWGAKGCLDGLSDQGNQLGRPARVTLPSPPPEYVNIEMA